MEKKISQIRATENPEHWNEWKQKARREPKRAGFDPKQARCRLNWGMPEALDNEKLAALLPHLVELQLNAVIKPNEIRSILRDVCKLPLEDIERPEFVAEQPVTAE